MDGGVAACLLGGLYVLRKRRHNRKRLQRDYVRPLNLSRKRTGKYENLIKRMRELDPERHFAYTSDTFDELLALVEESLTKNATHKLPISAAERLYITLDYLATGSTQQNLAHTYELGKWEFSTCLLSSELSKFIIRKIHCPWYRIRNDGCIMEWTER